MEVPSVCDHCLGEQEDIKLLKNSNGAECKICTFPFDVYTFKSNGQQHKTVICSRCSSQRNTCQVCMLDLTWHIPVSLRDQIVSILQQHDVKTTEAKNEMMKRFLAMKDVKLGGAAITSDPDKLNSLLQKLEHDPSVLSSTLTKGISQKRPNSSKFDNVNITPLLQKLPLKESLTNSESKDVSRSYFIYNIDQSLPEWKVASAIADIVQNQQWQDTNSNSLVINHKAKCGGIRFKDTSTAAKFFESLSKTGSTMTSSDNLIRGIIHCDQSRIFVVPWAAGFSAASFGATIGENVKLSMYLDKVIRTDLSHKPSLDQLPTKSTGQKIAKITKKKKKKSLRASHLDL